MRHTYRARLAQSGVEIYTIRNFGGGIISRPIDYFGAGDGI